MGRDCDFSAPPCLNLGCGHSYIEHRIVTQDGSYPVFGPCMHPSKPESDERKKGFPACLCPEFVHATTKYKRRSRPLWHFHVCPQCDWTWECGGTDCIGDQERWCPNLDLCHIKAGETMERHTIPKRRRKSRGIGPLFHELA